MAKTSTKNSKAAKQPKQPEASKANGAPPVPEGYGEQGTGDIDGFWVPTEIGVHFRPLGFTLSDSKIEKDKTAVLIIGTLLDPCKLAVKEDGEVVEVNGQPGDTVGIWGKPGMRAILRQGGKPTLLRVTGTKDVGKPQPMVTFAVLSDGKGSPLPMLDDHRKESIGSSCWALPRRKKAAAAVSEPDYDGDDVPF